MTELNLPNPGEGREWDVEFDDGDMYISLVETDGVGFASEAIVIERQWIRPAELSYTPHLAIKTAAENILKNDKLRELAGTYRYTNGKLEKV